MRSGKSRNPLNMKKLLFWIRSAMPTMPLPSSQSLCRGRMSSYSAAVPLGLFSVQVARIMGAVNIIMVGLDEDTKVRFDIAKELGATHVVNASKEDVVKKCQEICGVENLGLVVECSGANIALKQAIEMLRPNGEVVRVGMGFKPLEFSINDITSWNKSIIGHMAYDSTSWRNAIRLLEKGEIKVQPMITHRLGLSEWEKGFEAMADKEAIKVILTYDFKD